MLKWFKELFARRRETPASIVSFEQNRALLQTIELLNRQLVRAEERAEKFENLYLEQLKAPRPTPPTESLPSNRSWEVMRKQLEQANRKIRQIEEEKAV